MRLFAANRKLLCLLAALLLGGALAQEGVYYEIFVRSFQDSDGDGVGDLRGVTERLDYLEGLGVRGIWLMPIHPSPSYHGYDVTDYTAIHPDYGTLEDFDELVREAERRDIGIVLDLVVNHTSDRHPWFLAGSNGDPRYRSYYLWRDEDPGWRGVSGAPAWHRTPNGHYLGLFVGSMPDLDLENPEVAGELQEIARFWLGRGVRGFRVDAIQHLVESAEGGIRNTPATLRWVRDFEAFLKTVDPDAFLVGETWTDDDTIRDYLDDANLDFAFDYPLWGDLLGVLGSRSPINLRFLLERRAGLPGDPGRLATFLANHDQVRPATSLSPLRRDERRLALGAGLLITLPGLPFLYYGEEIGMPNGPGGNDEAKRTPMRWAPGPGAGFTDGEPWQPFSTDDPEVTVLAQAGAPGSLLETYRDLIGLRGRYPGLQGGGLELLPAEGPLLAFVRTDPAGDWRLLVVANFGREAAEYPLPEGGRDVWTGEGEEGVLEVPATGLRVLELP